MKYIDLEKLITEIKRLESEGYYSSISERCVGFYDALDVIKSFIVSLQQERTEVDFEKEIDMFVDGWSIDEDLGLVDDEGWSVTVGDIKNVARHFYELGLNARKGEQEQQEEIDKAFEEMGGDNDESPTLDE